MVNGHNTSGWRTRTGNEHLTSGARSLQSGMAPHMVLSLPLTLPLSWPLSFKSASVVLRPPLPI